VGGDLVDEVVNEHETATSASADINRTHGEPSPKSLRTLDQSRLQPIPLGLSLLVHTDKAKRRLILDEWEAAMKTTE